MSELVEQKSRREYAVVQDPVAIYDSARFEHMGRIAQMMARCSLIPESLYTVPDETDRRKKVILPVEVVAANCFLVVSYADRLGFDPFLVAQCTSVVRGRLMFEGKLIAAALDTKLGVQLSYEFGKWDPKTEACIVGPEGEGDLLGVRVSGSLAGIGVVEVHGSVGTWRTSGDGSPWKPGNFKRMLRYRGAREWARAHQPAIMLGVYTDDEMEDLVEDIRARRSEPVTIAERLAAPVEGAQGFNRAHIAAELGEPEQKKVAEKKADPKPRAKPKDKPAEDFAETRSDEREHPKEAVAAEHAPATERASADEDQAIETAATEDGASATEDGSDAGTEQAEQEVAAKGANADPQPPEGTTPETYAVEWRWRIRNAATVADADAMSQLWASTPEKQRRNKIGIDPDLRDKLRDEAKATAEALRAGG
ncbi:hypothetical protein [Ancylobacter defluvii]|uniref:Recombinase RecT n=1 Tax=Ancylobacter defluvii TaxID=1282440 RepID=A0A9W6K0G7_9HYPH|nr:hypothetical protein [Ancylobacter defluvii]MBS7588251.1 hypothetical protein [Ancylobacter defluvii]GLK86647.1 hypothetical protein GCM10017653_47170 [Ancylobacter defluvii]